MNWTTINNHCDLNKFKKEGYNWDYWNSHICIYHTDNKSTNVFECWDVEEDTYLFIEFVNNTLKGVR